MRRSSRRGSCAARPTLAGFPSPAAFALLRQWGVRYVVVAASSYGAQWAGTRAYFATLPDWTEAYPASQPVTWAAPFWVGDVRPELRDCARAGRISGVSAEIKPCLFRPAACLILTLLARPSLALGEGQRAWFFRPDRDLIWRR